MDSQQIEEYLQNSVLNDNSEVLNSDKTIKLSFSSHEQHNGLHIDEMATENSTMPLNNQQYYNNMQTQPIMVYELVPSANVPVLQIDSFVSVSLGGKNMNKKISNGIDLLQSAVDVADGTYNEDSRTMSPLYILPEVDKNSARQDMMVDENQTCQRFLLTERSENDFEKSNSVKDNSEFNLSFNTSASTVSNISNIPISAIYPSSNETDSEVALTLASLGNLKPEKLVTSCSKQLENSLSSKNTMSSSSARSSCSQPSTSSCSGSGSGLSKSETKSSLVLRSRRSRGTAPNPHYNDFTMEDPEKIGRRKKRKVNKVTANKISDSVLLKISDPNLMIPEILSSPSTSQSTFSNVQKPLENNSISTISHNHCEQNSHISLSHNITSITPNTDGSQNNSYTPLTSNHPTLISCHTLSNCNQNQGMSHCLSNNMHPQIMCHTLTNPTQDSLHTLSNNHIPQNILHNLQNNQNSQCLSQSLNDGHLSHSAQTLSSGDPSHHSLNHTLSHTIPNIHPSQCNITYTSNPPQSNMAISTPQSQLHDASLTLSNLQQNNLSNAHNASIDPHLNISNVSLGSDLKQATHSITVVPQDANHVNMHNGNQKENLLGQLLKASEHCEPATLIPEGVVDDVIPAVGYRIMDMSNLTQMIQMMHRCSGSMGSIVIQEQASLREGAVSQLSVICTDCQEGAVCATSNRTDAGVWDINTRVEKLRSEFDIKEDQLQKMLEILGIFYRPCDTNLNTVLPTSIPITNSQANPNTNKKRKRKKKSDETGAPPTPKPKNLECTVCKEKFAGENHLKKHMHVHNRTLHTCPYCHAYFKKSFNLKEHIKKHENYKYECKYCHITVTDKSTLRLHIKSQHEKKFSLQCSKCDKVFYHRQHLNEHMRIHTKEKPYSCEICSKKFSWHDSLKKHMQTHVVESKYKCRLCGKWFRWLQAVRQHLQQQHKLKKCDVEAQVMTASSQNVPVVQLYDYHVMQTTSGVTDLGNRQQTVNEVSTNYHSLENATPQDASQDALAIFTINEVQNQQDIFTYQ